MKKTLALLLAIVMIFALAAPVMAADNGSITISNTATNAEYKIYKIFDATIRDGGAISYTYSGTLAANDYFAQDSYGYITVKDAAKDANGELTADAIAFLGTLKGTTATATANGNGGNLTFSGLDYGYYYVETTTGAAVTVTSTNPNATVIDKNDPGPGPVDPNIPFKTADKESASIGENVNYTIQWKATNYIIKDGKAEKVTKYTVTDESSNLIIDWSTLRVTVDGKEITNYTVTKGTPIENLEQETYKTTDIITIPWVDENGNSLYGSPVNVVITYTAEVYKYGDAHNRATITSNTDSGETPIDPPGDVDVDNYQLEIFKIDSNVRKDHQINEAYDLVEENNDLTLAGAEFELYYDKELKHKVQLVEEAEYNEENDRIDGGYRLATQEEYNAYGFKSAVIRYGCKDGVGFYEVNGLAAGTYYLVEVKAPDGYNRLTEPVTVVVTSDDNQIIVENNTGAELPSTGGIGTTIFYIVGGLLMVGAAVVLVTRKKVSAEK